MRDTKIIVLTQGLRVETWGTLTELCRVHKFPHGTLERKKYPFTWNGITFNKVDYRKKNGIINRGDKNNIGDLLDQNRLINTVTKVFAVSPQSVSNKTRKREVVNARKLISLILKTKTSLSYKSIGAILGNRDHATVINLVQRGIEHLGSDYDFQEKAFDIIEAYDISNEQIKQLVK